MSKTTGPNGPTVPAPAATDVDYQSDRPGPGLTRRMDLTQMWDRDRVKTKDFRNPNRVKARTKPIERSQPG